MTTVISVENVSKYYRLGVIGSSTVAADLNRAFRRLRGQYNPALQIGQTDNNNREGEYIWALRDVSFQVEQGEVLGIIGRNGAGKSTLLKILSRVTGPTAGVVKLKGRIASLLEVGTGFHPELTGRENIYLNGAILGMNKLEIAHKFDEIVEFSEVAKFIDTPVKHYSSGMYVRLAFAVAAHLEPEILIVDEVLAVGDAAFQKKCLGKMGAVAGEGRTVLFVSHNMGAVSSLCERAILLKEGFLIVDSPTNEAISLYLSDSVKNSYIREWAVSQIPGNEEIRLKSARILSEEKQPIEIVNPWSPFLIAITCQIFKPFPSKVVGISVFTSRGEELFNSHNDDNELTSVPSWDVGTYTFYCRIPPFLLNEGQYYVRIASTRGAAVCFIEDRALDFTVSPVGTVGDYRRRGGFFRLLLEWSHSRDL